MKKTPGDTRKLTRRALSNIYRPSPRGCVARHAQFGRGRRVTLRRWPAGSSPPCPPIVVRVAMPVRRRRSPLPRISSIMVVPSPATAFSSLTLHRFFISLQHPSLRARTHTHRIVPSHTAYHHVARNPSVAAILRCGFRNFMCSTVQSQLPSALLLLQSAGVNANPRSEFSVFSPLTIEFFLNRAAAG